MPCDVLIPHLRSSTKCLKGVFTKPENGLLWATQACNETSYKKKEKMKKGKRKKERKNDMKSLTLIPLMWRIG